MFWDCVVSMGSLLLMFQHNMSFLSSRLKMPKQNSATSHKIKDFKCNGCYILVMSYKEEVPQDLTYNSSDDQIC